MEFKSFIAHWLDTLPLDSSIPLAEGEQKRRPPQSSQTGGSRKRPRQQPSPPSSTMPLSTPNHSPRKRAGADADEQTPRPSRTSANRGNNADNVPSLSSSSSKRSRRSQSPTKFFPLYGPEDRRLLRDSLNTMTIAPSPTLRDLLGDMTDVAGRYAIMPLRVKAPTERHLVATGQFDRLHEYMFCDDAAWHHSCLDGEGLVRRAVRIAARSAECLRMLSDELAWNNLVHSQLLDMLVHDMQDGPGQDMLDFLSCTTTGIDPTYHRFPDSASRVDYMFQLFPERDATISSHGDALLRMRPCFNWTADRLLQQYPLAISIETKRYGGDTVRGEQQLGIWHAAHWEFLVSRAGQDAAEVLGILPSVVVQGHTWSLVVSARRQGTTTMLCSMEFGSTVSVTGVFQVLAGMRRLRNWSLDVLWPWYKQHLPELAGLHP
ncbi:hypothetical protein S40285_09608 [Stachybotrys chlorohalonatus IBT 40285]|uniref:PD-(D/E)XK nuclease-like domain-containing protein n=1 Tax=Stachybotrys chlorohalonatus (strain IBT 40285) TaxID=1283841 RepID=A0A084R186_STAC4|nr:hypothetical protein S40285_09608 [Stachybotrys chlorohalonata IBT 40285]